MSSSDSSYCSVTSTKVPLDLSRLALDVLAFGLKRDQLLGNLKLMNGYLFQNLKAALKHGTDYLLACHPEKFKLYGQVGIGKIDHGRWGRPEDITWKRPAFFIGLDLYLEI